MKFLSSLLLITFFLGCKSQSYQLEEHKDILLKEGFVTVVPPAIAEGKTTISAYLNFKEFDTGKYQIKGFYFRNQFIPYKQMANPFLVEGSVFENEKVIENIPFNLKPYEVVLSYTQKQKKKYAKYNLKRKVSLDDVPR